MVATVPVIVLPFSQYIVDWLAKPVTKLNYTLVFTAPAEAFWVQMKVGLIVGIFLSAPVIVHNRVAGVINVQHREPHFHTGGEMELLTTVGEQVGCLVALGSSGPIETGNVMDLVMAPARRR